MHSEQRNRPGLAALSFLLQIGQERKILGNTEAVAVWSPAWKKAVASSRLSLILKNWEKPELEDFVDFGLDLEEDDVAAPRLDCLEERGEGSDTGGGDVVEAAAVENKAYEAGVDRLADALLKEIGVYVSIYPVKKRARQFPRARLFGGGS